jgi:hypothetical protein
VTHRSRCRASEPRPGSISNARSVTALAETAYAGGTPDTIIAEAKPGKRATLQHYVHMLEAARSIVMHWLAATEAGDVGCL